MSKDTIESYDSTRQQSEPPSWRELASEVQAKQGLAGILIVSVGSLLLSAVFPIPLFAAIFMLSFGGRMLNRIGVKSSMVGGAVAGVIAQVFLSGIVGFVSSVLIIPIIIPLLVGVIMGGIGSYLGKLLVQRL